MQRRKPKLEAFNGLRGRSLTSEALRFIHQRPIYLILFPSLALLSSSVPTSAPPRKTASLPLLTDPYVTFFFSNTPTKNNSSVYFTVQNWSKSPKKYPHFFSLFVSMRRRKKQETNEKSITEDLSNLEHFVFLEESKKCVFQNQSCPKSYEALRCSLPV